MGSWEATVGREMTRKLGLCFPGTGKSILCRLAFKPSSFCSRKKCSHLKLHTTLDIMNQVSEGERTQMCFSPKEMDKHLIAINCLLMILFRYHEQR
jgi:hypothetical protein